MSTPVPCENCGAAIEPTKRLCIYCASKLAKRPDVQTTVNIRPRPARVVQRAAALGLVAAWCGSRPLVAPRSRGGRRRGFTLVELMVALVITSIVIGSLMLWVPRHVADLWMSKGAAGVHAELTTARNHAMGGSTAAPGRVVGFRLIPDPEWPVIKLPDGTVDPSAPIGYARAAPLVTVQPHRAGYASVHADGWPPGFAPLPGRLVLEESPVDPDGHRAEPTTWYWLVRLGDVVTVHHREYTVCGPDVVPYGPENPEGFANVGWPGAVSPLDRGAGPVEWLYLCNRVDDDGDGLTDEGWDGLDDDLDGLVDEADEWERERWLNVPAGGLAAAPYSIARRPVTADVRSGGDVANRDVVPSPVVVDGRKSLLPVDPYTGAVDIVFDDDGRFATTTVYGRRWSPPIGVGSIHFWVVQRADVAKPPEADGLAKVVTLDLGTGRVAAVEADPIDVAGTLARGDGR